MAVGQSAPVSCAGLRGRRGRAGAFLGDSGSLSAEAIGAALVARAELESASCGPCAAVAATGATASTDGVTGLRLRARPRAGAADVAGGMGLGDSVGCSWAGCSMVRVSMAGGSVVRGCCRK